MTNNKTIFTCSACDAQFQKWVGRCLTCGKWGTIDKEPTRVQEKTEAPEYAAAKTFGLAEISDTNTLRIKTNIGELDRVLGGGLVPGSLILLGGEPGIGKSTLAGQIATLLPNVAYISGEESVEQIKLRLQRLGATSATLRLGNDTHLENILAAIANSSLAIIDSIQTIASADNDGEAGSVGQVRACTGKLMEFAKKNNKTIILIGQVTKDGAVAGPKLLEHIVDTVLYLEGDRFHQFRILRAQKNRFGSTDELGVFSMEETGLVEVTNPSAALLAGRPDKIAGSAITCLMEGSRPMLLEIQALVSKTAFGYPQRRSTGFDLNRLQMLSAVLSKRAGLPLETYDIFLNVVGGVQAEEPAADLAVALAIASALKDKELPKTMAVFGEIGLSGEVRAVSQIKKRLEEIKRMGFEFAVIPHLADMPKVAGLKIAGIRNVQEVVDKIIVK
ncbi:MAG: DNA repair protein RadA [bacterium]|nr:DNA repair protein RadA [bacterium]